MLAKFNLPKKEYGILKILKAYRTKHFSFSFVDEMAVSHMGKQSQIELYKLITTSSGLAQCLELVLLKRKSR